MSKWVMTERKLITVTETLSDKYAVPNTRTVGRIFDVGEDAPAGHEGRPYTRKVEDAAQRIVEDAPNRMLDTSSAKKRGRPRKAQP